MPLRNELVTSRRCAAVLSSRSTQVFCVCPPERATLCCGPRQGLLWFGAQMHDSGVVRMAKRFTGGILKADDGILAVTTRCALDHHFDTLGERLSLLDVFTRDCDHVEKTWRAVSCRAREHVTRFRHVPSQLTNRRTDPVIAAFRARSIYGAAVLVQFAAEQAQRACPSPCARRARATRRPWPGNT